MSLPSLDGSQDLSLEDHMDPSSSSHQTRDSFEGTSHNTMSAVDNCHLAGKLIANTRVNGCPRRTGKDFAFLQAIGEGAYSCVYRAREIQSDAEFAIKVIQKSYVNRHQKMEAIIREKNILNYLTQMNGGNPFVTQLYSAFQDSSRLYIVMSFAERGDLLDALSHFGSFDMPTTRFFCSEILSGVDYLHMCNIIHRDLKPENVLIKADGHVMITDFGSAQAYQDLCLPNYDFGEEEAFSARSSDSESTGFDYRNNSDNSNTEDNGYEKGRRTTFVGTAQYVSPEMLQDSEVGPHSDIWAYGCILYQCLSGLAPFRAVNEYHMMKKIQEVEYSFPDGFPMEGRDLVSKILVCNPEKRYDINEIMNHSFFNGIDWNNMEDITPPTLHAYLPATFGEPEFHSNIDAGLDDRALIRLMNLVPAGESSTKKDETPENTGKSEDEKTICDENKNDAEKVNGLGESKSADEFKITMSTDVKDGKLVVKPLSSLIFDDIDEPYELYPRTKSQIERMDAIRRERVEKQRVENPYHLFTNGEMILKQGFLEKKRGLFARKRMFILTEGPHLLYVDPANMELKGEIPWTPCMTVEIKNFGTFFIHTPNRVYYLFDEERRALEWCQAIESVKKRYENEIEETYNNCMADGTFFTKYGKKKSRKEMMRVQKALLRKKAKDEKKAAKRAAQQAKRGSQ